MSEKPEKVHVVMRRMPYRTFPTPVKVADDRADARAYAKRMNARSSRYEYTVKSCPKL